MKKNPYHNDIVQGKKDNSYVTGIVKTDGDFKGKKLEMCLYANPQRTLLLLKDAFIVHNMTLVCDAYDKGIWRFSSDVTDMNEKMHRVQGVIKHGGVLKFDNVEIKVSGKAYDSHFAIKNEAVQFISKCTLNYNPKFPTWIYTIKGAAIEPNNEEEKNEPK